MINLAYLFEDKIGKMLSSHLGGIPQRKMLFKGSLREWRDGQVVKAPALTEHLDSVPALTLV